MRIARGISIVNTSKPISTAAAFDADAVAFFTAASITDNTQKSAVNTLVLSLKSANIWAKMKALYPVVGGVASSHAVNLKTPGTYNLTFATGWTHSSTGMTPLNAYANTSLIPSNSLLLNNCHMSYYSRTNNTSSPYGQEMGCGDTSNATVPTLVLSAYILIGSNIGKFYSYNGNTGFDGPEGISTLNTNSLGHYIGSRTSSSLAKFYKNSNQIGSNSNSASQFQPTIAIYIGCQNFLNSGYSFTNKQCAFASIGDGLTDAEASSFYTAVQTYQTTLGRQI